MGISSEAFIHFFKRLNLRIRKENHVLEREEEKGEEISSGLFLLFHLFLSKILKIYKTTQCRMDALLLENVR